MSKDVPVGYKLTEVGVIPEDWDVAEAWEVCELVVDCKNRTPPVVESSDFAVVRTPNVRHGKFIREELRFTDEKSFIEWTTRAVPQVGDVLVTREAPLGEVCLVPDDLKVCLGQRMMLYRPDAAKTDSIFLLYALMSSSVQTNLHKKIGGSTVGHARVDDIRNLQIPFPKTKVEQEAIARVLSDTDALITSLDKLIAKKRDIKQAAMQQLLTGKQRLEGFGDSSGKFKQTEIGLIPEDWQSITLGEIFTLKNGYSFSSEFFSDRGEVVLTPGNFRLNGGLYFDERNTKRYSGIYPKSMIFSNNDLLIVMTDLTPECNLLGKPAFVNSNEVILHNQRIGKVVLKVRDSDTKYLYYVLLSSRYLNQIRNLATGSTVRHTSPKSIYSVSIAFPYATNEQQAIAKVLSDMDIEISALEQRRDKTKALKLAMMQELLTGRIRLL